MLVHKYYGDILCVGVCEWSESNLILFGNINASELVILIVNG